MGIKDIANKLLHNKYVLYFLLAWSLFTVLTVQVHHLAYFLAIAAATFYFVSRNMIIVLAVPILVIHVMTAHGFLERMTTQEDAAKEDEKKATDKKPESNSAGKQQEKPSDAPSNPSGQGINAAPLDGTADSDKMETDTANMEAAALAVVEDTLANAEKGMADMTEAYTNLGGNWSKEIEQSSKSLMQAIGKFSPSMASLKL